MAKNISAARARIVAYKCCFYGVLLFIFAVAQVTFFTKITFLSATPDVLLACVVAIAMREEHRVSAICGIVAGFLYCALGGVLFPAYILFSFLCGYIVWGISEHAFAKNYPSYLALCALTFGAKVFYSLLETAFTAQSFNIIGFVFDLAIPELLSSMLFCSIPYLIFIIPIKLLNKKTKRSPQK